MKSSDDVFNLIKSLTPSEKRYFKGFASRHVIGKKNNYLLLFEAMQKQADYDEATIKKEFKGESFLKHFRILKHNLYQQLLKSLSNNSGSLDAQVFQMLLQVEMLYKKAFYKQARKLLVKARKFALEHEKFLSLLEIIRWEQKLRIVMLDVKNAKELVEEENQLLAVIENERRYNQLAFLVFSLFTKIGSIRRQEDLDQVEELMSDPLMEDESKALSDRARLRFHILHTHYHFHQGRYKEAYGYIRRARELMESRPALIRDNGFEYIVVLHNYLVVCSQLGLYEEIPSALEKLKRLSQDYSDAHSTNLDFWVFVLTSTFEMFILLKNGEYAKSTALIPSIQAGLEEYGDKINKRDTLIFRFNFAHSHFGLGQHSAALKHLNEILNDEEAHLREDIYGIARLFNLILHFELGNEELLEYIVKSTKRQLSKKKSLLKLDAFILEFIKQLPAHKKRDQFRESLDQLRAKLMTLKDDPMEGKRLEIFHFIPWIDSKLEGRPFHEIVRERAINKH